MMLVLFLSAIVAWLMGLLNWLINSVKNSLTYFSHFMITGVIGFGGFHHSIVGNIEVLELFTHKHNFRLPKVSVFSHSGNAIGGAVVVGLFKYRIFESNNMK
jgi:formate/nitrite transporter FocA (FNT family)